MLFYLGVAIVTLILWVALRFKGGQKKESWDRNPVEPKPQTESIPQVEPTKQSVQSSDAEGKLKEGLTKQTVLHVEQESIDKRIRVAEQTKKAFEKKGKATLEIGKATGKLVPPGQRLTKKWVVLDLGLRPEKFDLDTWTLKLVDSKTKREEVLTLPMIKSFGVKSFKSDFHCYTGWTVQDLSLTGVPFKRIIEHFAPSPTWKFLFQIGADGYTTNSPRTEWEREDVFLGWELDGSTIPTDHGIIRLFNPTLYGSKSSKFLSEIHFMESDFKGFWEIRGVHERGNVFFEERYGQRKREKTGIEEAERIIQECAESLVTELDLSGLELTEIPASVFSLTHLRTILLFNNSISSIPEAALALTKLMTLSLNSNKFTEIPAVVSKFRKLSELWICDNHVTVLPEHLLEAQNLFVLGIEANGLSEIPPWISRIPKLGVIFGDRNSIKRIPREIADRPWQALLFSENPIEFIPKEISKLTEITFLGFFGVTCLPTDVLEEGTQGILRYLSEHGDATKIPEKL